MDGAVRGRRLYGRIPQPADDGPDDVGQGRLLPALAVDRLGATLATWFGVSATGLPTGLPQIVGDTRRDLGRFG
jgi:uncharacterized protein (DUF1501 family)